jgi:hypothetical protein
MRDKAKAQGAARCCATVSRGRMGVGQCANRASNGDLCHRHAALEDRGKTVNRIPPKERSQ